VRTGGGEGSKGSKEPATKGRRNQRPKEEETSDGRKKEEGTGRTQRRGRRPPPSPFCRSVDVGGQPTARYIRCTPAGRARSDVEHGWLSCQVWAVHTVFTRSSSRHPRKTDGGPSNASLESCQESQSGGERNGAGLGGALETAGRGKGRGKREGRRTGVSAVRPAREQKRKKGKEEKKEKKKKGKTKLRRYPASIAIIASTAAHFWRACLRELSAGRVQRAAEGEEGGSGRFGPTPDSHLLVECVIGYRRLRQPGGIR